MKQWDKIFRERGRVFIKVQEDIPKIAKLFKERGIKRILDLGCGSGRHLVYFAKKGFEVYGIDIAIQGIKLAKQWLKEEGLKANLKIGDIYQKLPYQSNFFDAIISIATLHHNRIGKIRKLIKEIERILKPKGLVFITVTKRKTKEELKKIPKEKVWKIKMIAPRTFIPLTHEEQGLIHYWFNKRLLRKEFKNFKIFSIWVKEGEYCFIGELKSIKNQHPKLVERYREIYFTKSDYWEKIEKEIENYGKRNKLNFKIYFHHLKTFA